MSTSIAQADARQDLADLFLPHVKTLTRPVHLFNYSQLAPPSELKAWNALERARQSAHLFRYPPATGTGGTAGSGLYLALDPYSTAIYGGLNWLLTEVTLPLGTRYLDLHAGGFNKDLLEKLRAEGCRPIIRDLVSIFSAEPQRGCHGIRTWLVDHFEVVALRYPYHSLAPEKICDTKNMELAFVLVDPRVLTPETVTAFTADLSPQLNEEALLINEFGKLLAPAGSDLARCTRWPDLASSRPQGSATEWIKTGIMGCGAYEEDRLSSRIPGYIPLTHGEPGDPLTPHSR